MRKLNDERDETAGLQPIGKLASQVSEQATAAYRSRVLASERKQRKAVGGPLSADELRARFPVESPALRASIEEAEE
jgi:hypothetical protein